MTQPKNIPRLLLEVLALIGVIEVSIMLVMPIMLPGLGGTVAAALDAALLALIATPLVVWRVGRALHQSGSTPEAGVISIRIHLLAAVLVLMGGLAVTGIAMSGAHAEMHDKARINFQGMKSMLADEASWRLTQQSFGLKGARGLFAANEIVRRDQFRSYVQSRNVGEESSGVTGIGFIGAGSILKLNEQRDVQGLTTAAGVWMTAAIGVAVGLGSLGVAILSTLFTLAILMLSKGDYQPDVPAPDARDSAKREESA